MAKHIVSDVAALDVAAFHELERSNWKVYERVIKDMIRARCYRQWRTHHDGCADSSDCPECVRLVVRFADRISWFITPPIRVALVRYCREAGMRFDDVKREHLTVGIYLALADEHKRSDAIRFGRTLYASADDDCIVFATTKGIALPPVDLGTGAADFCEWLQITAVRYANASLAEVLKDYHEAGPTWMQDNAAARFLEPGRGGRARQPRYLPSQRTTEPSRLEGRVRELRLQNPKWTARQIAGCLGGDTTPGAVRVMEYRLRRKAGR